MRGCRLLPPSKMRLVLLVVVLGMASILLNVYSTKLMSIQQPNEQLLMFDLQETSVRTSTAKKIVMARLQHETMTPKIFHCGGVALNRNFQPALQSILSEYTYVDFSKMEDVVTIDHQFKNSHPWDIFVSNYQLNECSKTNKDANKDVYCWLQSSQFQGKVVFWTPKDATNYKAIAI
jgi:hypothetical protein